MFTFQTKNQTQIQTQGIAFLGMKAKIELLHIEVLPGSIDASGASTSLHENSHIGYYLIFLRMTKMAM